MLHWDWLWQWIATWPMLGFTPALVILILWRAGLTGLGLPGVFWHESPFRRFANGVSVAGLFALTTYVGSLLATKPVESYVRFFGIVLTLFVLFAVRKFSDLALIAGYFTGGALAIGAGLLLRHWLPNAERLADVLRPHPRPGDVEAFCVLLLLSIIYVLLAAFSRFVPAGSSICVLLAMFVMLYGAVQHYFERTYFAIYVGLAIYIGIVGLLTKRKHRFNALSYKQIRKLEEAPSSKAPVDDGAALRVWLDAHPNRKLIVVATTGGGIRAAVWTAVTLAELSRKIEGFRDSVRIITGASGGMLGAAAFVVDPNDDGEEIARDSLDPVASTLALRDLPGLLFPWRKDDRGNVIEKAWIKNKPALKVKLSDLVDRERNATIPSLVFTPMLVEDGRRLIVSNLDLQPLTYAEGPQLDSSEPYSISAIELLKYIEESATMPLVTAVRMSASFPWVMPAAELPVDPRRHVVDAGYFDDYGVFTAASWIAEHADDLRERTRGVALVQIRDVAQEVDYTDVACSKSPSILRAFDELVAPVFGALRERGASMVYRNDVDLEALALLFPKDFFTTVIFENPAKEALNWYLSPEERRQLLTAYANDAKLSKRVDEVQKWFSS